MSAFISVSYTHLMAAVLPGNRVLPFADLAVVTFRVALVVAVTRGNLFKNIIMGLVCTGAILLAGTATAPVLTELALSVGLDLGEGPVSYPHLYSHTGWPSTSTVPFVAS